MPVQTVGQRVGVEQQHIVAVDEVFVFEAIFNVDEMVEVDFDFEEEFIAAEYSC